ncbi:LysR substrate-binding domain-containing protein [Alcanivorax sp.]|jgi:DNA-binding transcriptional LysR family regulator|uniref:LysR family transcriptional regulator n=1 Tax=Alcanivorax sp. TaxID=1872427 RepID=UPI0032D91300
MKPLLDLELLNAFATVVDCGGFKEAAGQLHRSQGAVSMQIKRLEDQVGQRLLERSNRGIKLTKPGQTLLSYIDRILRLNHETLSALVENTLRGPIHFGIPTDYAQTFLEGFIPRIRSTFPEAQITISCGRSRKLREMVTSGEIDMAIVTAEPQFENEANLWSEPLRWCALDGFTAVPDQPLPVALLNSDCALRDLAIVDLKESGLDHHVALASNDLANIASAVAAGLAVALLPTSSVASSKVLPVTFDGLPGPRLLTMNVIDAGTLGNTILESLKACMIDAANDLQPRTSIPT